MKNFKAVIFDMDGVIFDSEKEVLYCWQVIAEKYGISDIEYMVRQCLGINRTVTKQKFLDHYGEDFPYDDYKKEMSDLFHERNKGGKLPKKPGVSELLKALKEAGIPTAIASSTREAVVVREIKDGGLYPYFHKIICGDMVTKSKPDPEIFLKACEELGVDPSESIVIEDSYNGIRAASAGGMIPIMVPDMLQPTEEIRQMCEEVLPSLYEVEKTLFTV